MDYRKTVAEQELSQTGRSLLAKATLNKRLQTDRAVVGDQRENQRTFPP